MRKPFLLSLRQFSARCEAMRAPAPHHSAFAMCQLALCAAGQCCSPASWPADRPVAATRHKRAACGPSSGAATPPKAAVVGRTLPRSCRVRQVAVAVVYYRFLKQHRCRDLLQEPRHQASKEGVRAGIEMPRAWFRRVARGWFGLSCRRVVGSAQPPLNLPRPPGTLVCGTWKPRLRGECECTDMCQDTCTCLCSAACSSVVACL